MQPTKPGDPPTFVSCHSMCPNLLNLKCLMVRGCWRRLAQALLVIALLAAVITVLWLALRNGWVKRIARCMACMLAPQKPEGRKRRRGDEERRSGGSEGSGQDGDDEAGDDASSEVVESPKKKRLSATRRLSEEAQANVAAAEATLRGKLGRQQQPVPEQLIGTGLYTQAAVAAQPLQHQMHAQPKAQQPQLHPGPLPMYLPLSYLEMQQHQPQRQLRTGASLPRWAAPQPQTLPVLVNNPLAWQDAGLPAGRVEVQPLEEEQEGDAGDDYASEEEEENVDEVQADEGAEEAVAAIDDADGDSDDVAELACTVAPRGAPGSRRPCD
jgi:hypothetical protein